MTTTTVRPTSTSKNSSVGTTGGFAVSTVTGDTNNTTRAQGTINGATAWLEIPGVTLASNERLKQARIGLVYAHDGVDIGHVERVNYRFRDPVLNVGGIDSQASTYSSTFPAANAPLWGPWNTKAPNGSGWTQAVIDRLQVSLFWLASVNNQFPYVSEVYVQFETNEQPVVTGIGVTGYDNSTRPDVVFEFNDADGDQQTAYVAKAFTLAQYSATNFNPEVSDAAWNSGEVLSDAASFSIDSDLMNGETYEIWVKAAQHWDGPEGTRWYSNWASSSPFTIALSPPPAPTLTVDQQLDTPHYRNRVIVSLAGMNVFDADTAGAENGPGTWVADTNANTPTTSSAHPKSGADSILITSTSTGPVIVASGTFATGHRVQPGNDISVTNSLRADTTGRTISAGIRYFDVFGANVGTDSYGVTGVSATTGYATVTYSGVVPATAYRAVTLVKIGAASSGESHYLDENGLIYGSDPTWSPGGYLQTGSVHLEASQRVSDEVTRNPARNFAHPQLYSGGALTGNTDGFYPRGSADSIAYKLLDRAPPEAAENTTAGMMEWTLRSGGTAFLDICTPALQPTDGMQPYMFPAVPDVDYVDSVWLWSSVAVTGRIGVVYTDEFNTQVGSTTVSNVVTLGLVEQRVDVSSTAPTGTVYARMYVESGGVSDVRVRMTNVRSRLASSPDEPWPGQVFAFTWYDVRNGRVALPQDGSDTLWVYDHEAPPDRPIIYSARIDALTPDGSDISSDRSRFVHVYMTPPIHSVLKDTSQPENSFEILYRGRGDTVTSEEETTELHLAGRNKDAVFGRDWFSGDKGEIVIHLVDELSVYRLEQVLPTDRTVLIQWRVGGQLYAHITGYEITRQLEINDDTCRDTYAIATLRYVEQARPETSASVIAASTGFDVNTECLMFINVDEQSGNSDDAKIDAALARAASSSVSKILWFSPRQYVVNKDHTLTSLSDAQLFFSPGSSIKIGPTRSGLLADRARVFTLDQCNRVVITGIKVNAPSTPLLGTPTDERAIIEIYRSSDCRVERGTFDLTNIWATSNTYSDGGIDYQYAAAAVWVKGPNASRNVITDCVVTAGIGVVYAYSASSQTTVQRVTVLNSPGNGLTGIGNDSSWSENNVVDNCVIVAPARIGIEDWNKIRRTVISDCKVTNPGLMGISCVGASTRVVRGHIEGAPTYTGLELSSTNARVEGTRIIVDDSTPRGIIVDGNTAVTNGDTITQGTLIDGAEVYSGVYGIELANNANPGQLRVINCKIHDWIERGLALGVDPANSLPVVVSGCYLENSLPSVSTTAGIRFGIQVNTGGRVDNSEVRILSSANGGVVNDIPLIFSLSDQVWSDIRVDGGGVTSPAVPLSYSFGNTPSGLIFENIVLTGGAQLSLQFLQSPTARNISGTVTWGSGASATSPVKTSVMGGVEFWAGTGTPESVVTAPVGSLYFRRDGATTTGVYVKETGSGNTGWITKANAVVIDEFTSAGSFTWTKPTGAVLVDVELFSGGNGGGSGRRGAAGTNRYGGNGGPLANRIIRRFHASDLTSTVSVTVGAGGAGGTAITSNDTDGNAGSAGGTSSFGAYVNSPAAASGGAAGTSTAGGAGSSQSGANIAGQSGGTGSYATVAGGAGGGGGGISNADVGNAGGAGGTTTDDPTAGSAGGAINTNAANATARTPANVGGRAGGGGGAGTSGAAGKGGNGAAPGGSGGGGGGSLNGNNSGAGGTGADGLVRVITYY